MDKPPPDTNLDDRVEITANTVFGPVRQSCVFNTPRASYVSVQIPVPQYGLRWVNVWFDDTNSPT